LWLMTWCCSWALLPNQETLVTRTGGRLDFLLPEWGCRSLDHVGLEFGLIWLWSHLKEPILIPCLVSHDCTSFSFSVNHYAAASTWAFSAPTWLRLTYLSSYSTCDEAVDLWGLINGHKNMKSIWFLVWSWYGKTILIWSTACCFQYPVMTESEQRLDD
jgi:hypothetical protein